MSHANPTERPWYCNDALVEDYKTAGREGGDLQMMKAARWVRSVIVNLGFIAITLYSLRLGADVTVVAALGLVSLAAYNGVELADYGALAQAIVELSNEQTNDSEDN